VFVGFDSCRSTSTLDRRGNRAECPRLYVHSKWHSVHSGILFQSILWFSLGAWNDQPGGAFLQLLNRERRHSLISLSSHSCVSLSAHRLWVFVGVLERWSLLSGSDYLGTLFGFLNAGSEFVRPDIVGPDARALKTNILRPNL